MTVQPNLYGVVHSKIKREVVLLNTSGGCSWGRCAFCEYHYTYSRNAYEAAQFNKSVLANVRGVYDTLEVMCSASFVELPMETWYDLYDTCIKNGIKTIHIEMHWIHRKQVSRIREFFARGGITCVIVFGVETFDFYRREVEWYKGYGHATPEQIAEYADGINLLIGVKGETLESIEADVNIALSNFKIVNLLMFEPNDSPIERDNYLVDLFYNSKLFRDIHNLENVQILDGLDRRAPDNLGYVGVGAHY